MARLKFRALIQGQNQPGNDVTALSRYVVLDIFNNTGNVAGTPECRIGTSGPWLSMPFGSGVYHYAFLDLAVGTHDVYYRDNRGERHLFDAIIEPYAASCYDGLDSLVPGTTIQVSDSSISITSAMTSAPAGVYPFTYSNDDSAYQSSGAFALTIGTILVDAMYRKTASGCSQATAENINVSQLPAVDATYTKTDPTILAGTDGTIDVTPTGGNGVYTYLWNDGVTTQDRTGLSAGIYTVTITSEGLTKFLAIVLEDPDEMVADYTTTDTTSIAGTDGTITVTPTGGSGLYEIIWADSVSTAFVRNGLTAGLYIAYVSDTVTLETVTLEITVNDPAPPPPPPGTYSFVPMMNSLRFVRRVTPDGCTVFQTFDNTLLCDEVHPYFSKTNYYQKVAQCDAFPIQWQSDFPQHTITLKNYSTGETIKEFVPELKLQLIGTVETFPLTITNDGAGKSRVYFSEGGIPIPLEAGDIFEIKNSVDGFDGIYEIVSIQDDILLGSQYLVINKSYAIGSPSSSADGEFPTSVVDFNIFEAVCSFDTVEPGEYHMEIVMLGEVETHTWESEPILIAAQHEETNLVEVRCADNAFDMVWTTGITSRRRVESWFHQRFVKGKRTVSRNCDGSLIKVSAQKQRRAKFQTVKLPPYLHEWLSVGFDCDTIRINGVAVQTDGDYSDPKYLTRYQLADSEIDVEFVNWFTTHNSDDIGDVDSDTGFIIANDGFIKR